MKILLLGVNFSPELVGVGKYTGEMADWLSNRNHEVRVITAPPYYPQWCVYSGYSPWFYEVEDVSSKNPDTPVMLKILRCPIWVPRTPSGFARILHLLSFMLSSFPALLAQLRWQPDVIWTVAPTFLCAPGALLAARLTGARSCLHIQDFEVDAAFELGMLKSRRLRTIITGLEMWLLRKFDRVSTISAKMRDKLIEKNVLQEKTMLLLNWVDTDSIAPSSRNNPFRTELGIPAEAVVALYSGNMGEKQGLEIVVEAARILGDSNDLFFVMCGEGSARTRLQSMGMAIQRMVFLPLQPASRLNDLLNLADIHLLPQRGDVADLVMPSKLTGMLASGKPVVATAAPGTQVAVVVEQCGLVVQPGDVKAFASAVSRLADDAPARAEMGAKARAYAEANLGRDVILSRFERELWSLVKS